MFHGYKEEVQKDCIGRVRLKKSCPSSTGHSVSLTYHSGYPEFHTCSMVTWHCPLSFALALPQQGYLKKQEISRHGDRMMV